MNNAPKELDTIADVVLRYRPPEKEDRLADLWIKERQIKEQLDKLRAERDREENVRT